MVPSRLITSSCSIFRSGKREGVTPSMLTWFGRMWLTPETVIFWCPVMSSCPPSPMTPAIPGGMAMGR